jgi:hypothetical protein
LYYCCLARSQCHHIEFLIKVASNLSKLESLEAICHPQIIKKKSESFIYKTCSEFVWVDRGPRNIEVKVLQHMVAATIEIVASSSESVDSRVNMPNLIITQVA